MTLDDDVGVPEQTLLQRGQPPEEPGLPIQGGDHLTLHRLDLVAGRCGHAHAAMVSPLSAALPPATPGPGEDSAEHTGRAPRGPALCRPGERDRPGRPDQVSPLEVALDLVDLGDHLAAPRPGLAQTVLGGGELVTVSARADLGPGRVDPPPAGGEGLSALWAGCR